jgi:hypothetical protein
MVLTVAGLVIDIDKWGRVSLQFLPIYGTEAKLREIKSAGSLPIWRNGFTVRPDAKTLVMEASNRIPIANIMQKKVILEIEPKEFDYTATGGIRGVMLHAISIRVILK